MKWFIRILSLTSLLLFFLAGSVHAQNGPGHGRRSHNSGTLEGKNVSGTVHGKRFIKRQQKHSQKKAFKQAKRNKREMKRP